MSRTRALAAAPLLLALFSVPAAAQTIRGRVVDAASGQPVPEATVTALSGSQAVETARSGPDGAFTLELREGGQYRLRAERVGYEASTSAVVRVFTHEAMEVDVRLSTSALRIPPVVVRARSEQRVSRLEANGFYGRRELGAGRFITRREIEQQRPLVISDVLRRHPGVGVIPYRHPWESRPHRRGVEVVLTRGGGPCSPEVFLDGMILGRTGSVPVDEVIDPTHIEAVEIYRSGSEIPPRFQRANNTCGVLVFWTRAGNTIVPEAPAAPPAETGR